MNNKPHMTPGVVRTTSGTRFDINNLSPDMIFLGDIATSLSKKTRFGGHTNCRHIINVADHSRTVVRILEEKDHDKKAQRWGLFHDAAEAYLWDAPDPIKVLFPEIEALEERVMKVIAEKFDLPWPMPALDKYGVDYADRQAFALEAHHFLEEDDWWTPPDIETSVMPDYRSDWRSSYKSFIYEYCRLFESK